MPKKQHSLDTDEMEEDEDKTILTSEDIDELEVSKIRGMKQSPSDYPNSEYFVSIDVLLDTGEEVVINSSSTRLEKLFKKLENRFGDYDEIPQGTLVRETGESEFDTHYTYEW